MAERDDPKDPSYRETGDACHVAGIYRSNCSDRDLVPVALGTHLPRCSVCHESVGWTLIQRA